MTPGRSLNGAWSLPRRGQDSRLLLLASKRARPEDAGIDDCKRHNPVIEILLCVALMFCGVAAGCDDNRKEQEKTPSNKSSVNGDIKIVKGYPKSHALTTKREEEVLPIASVNATWAVEASCPCDKLEIRQEIKGYVDVLGRDGSKATLTAKAIVEKTMSTGGVPDTEGTEAYDVRHPSSGQDNSKTEFIHDVGKSGSSRYPGKQVVCKKLDDKKSQADFYDEPGVNAVVGEKGNLYKEFNIRLTFRTIVLCDKKEIGSFVWRMKYDLPENPDRPKEVALGDLK